MSVGIDLFILEVRRTLGPIRPWTRVERSTNALEIFSIGGGRYVSQGEDSFTLTTCE